MMHSFLHVPLNKAPTASEYGCAALGNLAVKNEENKEAIVDTGGISTILSAMKIQSYYATSKPRDTSLFEISSTYEC